MIWWHFVEALHEKEKHSHYMPFKACSKTPFLAQDIPCRFVTLVKKYLRVLRVTECDAKLASCLRFLSLFFII